MPIIKSARKRVKVASKATIRNAKTKRQLKDSFKSFSKKASADGLREVQSAIDIASKKNVIHKNKAARLKARAARLAKEANIKPVKKATSPKPKATAKAAAPKKTTAKKPAAKKKA
ncbi:MAG TPA: 30S ribosomal protein S20 [Candidatus Saccharimonadales bacterium]